VYSDISVRGLIRAAVVPLTGFEDQGRHQGDQNQNLRGGFDSGKASAEALPGCIKCNLMK